MAATGVFFTVLPLSEYEYPTLMGWSRKMILALEFQLYGLCVVELPSFSMVHGPSSNRRPAEELHPGPPLSHRTSGSFSGEERDSKNLVQDVSENFSEEIICQEPKEYVFVLSDI